MKGKAKAESKRTIIDNYRKENIGLKDYIVSEKSKEKRKEKARLSSQTAKMTTTQTKFGQGNVENIVEELQKDIDEERNRQKEIEKNISDFQKKIKDKKQTLGGINAGFENQSALAKQV